MQTTSEITEPPAPRPPFNLDELAATAERFAGATLIPRKPLDEPWGLYLGEDPDNYPVMTAGIMPSWAKWLATLHNATPHLIAAARGPSWTLTPEWKAGAWIGRRATGTTLIFWDGKDETPTLPGSLPTYWLGPFEFPPF